MPATLPQLPVASAKGGAVNPWPASSPSLGSNVIANSYVLAVYSNYKSGATGGTVVPTDPDGGTYSAAEESGYAPLGGGFTLASGIYLMAAPAATTHGCTWAYTTNTRTGVAAVMEVNPGGSVGSPLDQVSSGNQQSATSPLALSTMTLAQSDEFVVAACQIVATTGLSNAGLSLGTGWTNFVSFQTSNTGTAIIFAYSLNWRSTSLTPSLSWSADASIVNVSMAVATFRNFEPGMPPIPSNQIIVFP